MNECANCQKEPRGARQGKAERLTSLLNTCAATILAVEHCQGDGVCEKKLYFMNECVNCQIMAMLEYLCRTLGNL